MRNTNGFTLIEMLIALAIVGILTAIAVPSYQDSVRKTKRAEGKSLLLDAAQKQEQHFTEHNRYATGITANTPPNDTLLTTVSESGHYVLTISNNTASTFTFTATPQASHSDTICGALTLDHLGIKGESGSGTIDDCW